MTPEERESILDKHKHVYNGYQTLQPNIPNPQPLYVQDYANDKEGITVSSKGKVMSYRNQNINESIKEGNMCEQCGSMMNEGETCEQCESRYESIKEGEMCEQCGGTMSEGKCKVCSKYKKYDVDLYDVEDLNPKNKFDYVEGIDLGESDWDIDSEFEVKKDFDLPKGHGHLKKGDKVKINKKWKNSAGDVFGSDKSMDNYGLSKDDIDYMSSDLDEIRIGDLELDKLYSMKFPKFDEPDFPKYDKKMKYTGKIHYKDGKPMHGFSSIEDEPSWASFAGDDDEELKDIYPIDLEEMESNYDYKLPAYQFKSNGPIDAYDEDDKNYFEDTVDVFDDEDLQAGRAFSDMGDKDEWSDEKILMSLRSDSNKSMGTDTSIDMDLSDVKEPYTFASGGPGRSIGVYEELDEESSAKIGSYANKSLKELQNELARLNSKADEHKEKDENLPVDIKMKLNQVRNAIQAKRKSKVEEEVDEDLKESFIKQKNKITEMFNRIQKY